MKIKELNGNGVTRLDKWEVMELIVWWIEERRTPTQEKVWSGNEKEECMIRNEKGEHI